MKKNARRTTAEVVTSLLNKHISCRSVWLGTEVVELEGASCADFFCAKTYLTINYELNSCAHGPFAYQGKAVNLLDSTSWAHNSLIPTYGIREYGLTNYAKSGLGYTGEAVDILECKSWANNSRFPIFGTGKSILDDPANSVLAYKGTAVDTLECKLRVDTAYIPTYGIREYGLTNCAKNTLAYTGTAVDALECKLWADTAYIPTYGIRGYDLANCKNSVLAYAAKAVDTLECNSWANISRFPLLGANKYISDNQIICGYTGIVSFPNNNVSLTDISPLSALGTSNLFHHNHLTGTTENNGLEWTNANPGSIGIISQDGFNHAYVKQNQETIFELCGLNIDSNKFSFYCDTKASRTSIENALCMALKSVKLKPEHIGLEYIDDEKRPIINVFFIFNSSINGEIIHIGDRITKSSK